MRQWQVIPNAVVFDNGSAFKGKLLSAFCDNLHIRLIHASVCHPQTNGRLERAFRDVHTATQHILVQPVTWEMTGRALLGLDPGTPIY